MTRLAWGVPGERYFEAGADRAVLYLPGQDGVPWNGLKAVNESPDGGSPTPYYIDGYKYLNVASAEEFKATLEAFSSPKEFAVCDGTKSIHNGLFATQQPRKPFSLSYRTLVGNGLAGVEFGYKLHLVYNALAAPSVRNNQTLGEGVNPLGLSWSITTTPPLLTGLKPTAHFVIDSRLTPPRLMSEIEDILYGSDETNARIPDVDELQELFQSPGPIVRQNRVSTPKPTVLAGSDWAAGYGLIPEDGWVGALLTANATPYIFTGFSDQAYLAGDQITLTVKYRVTAVAGLAAFISVIPHVRTGNVYHRGSHVTRPITIDKDEVVRIRWTAPVDIPAGNLDLAIVGSNSTGAGLSTADSGFAFRATEALIEPGWTIGTYFDGNTPDTNEETYEWLAAVNDSPSVMKSWY